MPCTRLEPERERQRLGAHVPTTKPPTDALGVSVHIGGAEAVPATSCGRVTSSFTAAQRPAPQAHRGTQRAQEPREDGRSQSQPASLPHPTGP